MEFEKSYQLGLYEKAMPAELEWNQRLRIAKETGFDYIEMSIDETQEKMSRLNWSMKEIEQLRLAQEIEGIYIESMCLSAQRRYPLGSKKWQQEAKELLEKSICFAKKWGYVIS